MLYLEAAIQGFSLKYSFSFKFSWGIPVWGAKLISSKAAGCISVVLVEEGSFMGVPQVFCLFYYLFCQRLFWGTVLGDCLIILSTFFSLMLHGRKVF